MTVTGTRHSAAPLTVGPEPRSEKHAAAATVAAGFTRVGLLSWYARRHVGVAVLPYIPTSPPAVESA